ncbi:hypothetical protein SAMN06269173_11533 [Hymenobacter mucosus]|uniref:Uncharacterized protein n=1 Tax=Hymenobacter mucosus TaxID=1411120 RepID=A0A239AV88_9BACT|nr:hypothetical protein SAMN06269173_11533 [Hymenobacter mucosus]
MYSHKARKNHIKNSIQRIISTLATCLALNETFKIRAIDLAQGFDKAVLDFEYDSSRDDESGHCCLQ